jgi:hypothetical protein
MAAGLGFKTFATGDVLSAADVNGYLMQGVLVFASAAARDAAITSPQEGQFAYLKDTNVTTYYTGSAWTNLDTTGMVNPMTTTGDTIYSSSGSTPARLGVGTTGQVMTVAAGVPTWATPAASSSGLVVVKTETTFTAVANTSTTFDNVFSSTYSHYVIKFIGQSSSGQNMLFQLRSAAPATLTNNYYGARYELGYTGASGATQFSGATSWSPCSLSPNTMSQELTMNISRVGNGSQSPLSDWTTGGAGNNGFMTGGGVTGFDMSATGFILSVASGTLTGTCAVYGLAKS